MKIKKIQVSNFKSFENLEIELNDFNLLVGANASGKSNFIEVFKFLRDITKYGLVNAISMQGDLEYLRNINLGCSKPSSFKIVVDDEGILPINLEKKENREKKKRALVVMAQEKIYEFSIKYINEGNDFQILEDKVTYNCNFFEMNNWEQKDNEMPEEIGSGKITTFRSNGKVEFKFELPESIPSLDEGDLNFLYSSFIETNFFEVTSELSKNTLLIEESLRFFPMIPPIEAGFQNISVFDLDPKLPRNAISFTGKTELEEDGSNLTIVLKNILKNEDKKNKFTNLLKDILPFVANLGVEKFADKYLFFKLKETYTNQELPASLLSDGTINIIALVIAIYFENGLTIIEELERDIHPFLISKIMEMIIDSSKNKQIIITTHSPETLKYVDLENILLISRNKKGFSTISRPIERKELQKFLENELGKIGIEDLYTQNLLEL